MAGPHPLQTVATPRETGKIMGKHIMSVFVRQPDKVSDAADSLSSPNGESTAAAVPGVSGTPLRSIMILGKTLSFKGELCADEDLLLLGRVEGTISHTASVTVGVGGVVI